MAVVGDGHDLRVARKHTVGVLPGGRAHRDLGREPRLHVGDAEGRLQRQLVLKTRVGRKEVRRRVRRGRRDDPVDRRRARLVDRQAGRSNCGADPPLLREVALRADRQAQVVGLAGEVRAAEKRRHGCRARDDVARGLVLLEAGEFSAQREPEPPARRIVGGAQGELDARELRRRGVAEALLPCPDRFHELSRDRVVPRVELDDGEPVRPIAVGRLEERADDGRDVLKAAARVGKRAHLDGRPLERAAGGAHRRRGRTREAGRVVPVGRGIVGSRHIGAAFEARRRAGRDPVCVGQEHVGRRNHRGDALGAGRGRQQPERNHHGGRNPERLQPVHAVGHVGYDSR